MTLSLHYFDVSIQKVINETSGIRTFVLKKPEDFNNSPGQFSWLTLPSLRAGVEFPKTPMAIGSGINEKELIFSFRNWGYLTAQFFELHEGDFLSISEPLGTALPMDLFETKKVLCIAGGTGIVPVRSFISSLNSNDMYKLFYGVRTPAELLYKDQLKKWNADIIVERTENDQNWNGPLGFVTKLITEDLIKTYQYCYVCGPLAMMQNAISELRKNGFDDENLYVSIEKIENNEVIGPVFPITDPNVEL